MTFPKMHIVSGVQLGIYEAGIKVPGRKDLLVIKAEAGSTMAGVFTRNAFCAAPVHICKQHLSELNSVDDFYLLVNTGNANAGTGEQGFIDAKKCCDSLGQITGQKNHQVFPFSTGVIGENLPVDKILAGLPHAVQDLCEDNWDNAAQAILTTDTVPKGASVQLQLQGQVVTITGMSKGSGMIRPDMATMLAYIATDAKIPTDILKQLLSEAADRSFNRITVDGDTSTNDSCMLIATGKTVDISVLAESELKQFKQALFDVFEDLAKAIVIDGEGATKLITVQVKNGLTEQECMDVAYTIAHSPLVKTAFFASDPNWGRILAAVGRSGINDLALEQIEIYLDELCIVSQGGKDSDYTEEAGQKIMDQDQITIQIDLARGQEKTQVWTCDFSYDYVKINAEYRT